MSFTATLTLTWSSATAASVPATTGPRRCGSADDAAQAPREHGEKACGDGRTQRLATRLADAIGEALRQMGLGAASRPSPTSTPAATDSASPGPAADTTVTSPPPDLNTAVQDFAQALAEALRGGLKRGHGDGERGHHGHHGHHGMAYGGMAARLETLAARYAAPQAPVTEAPASAPPAAPAPTAAPTAASAASASEAGDTLAQAFGQLFAAAGGVAAPPAEARGQLADFLSALARALRGDAANDETLPAVGGLVNVAA